MAKKTQEVHTVFQPTIIRMVDEYPELKDIDGIEFLPDEYIRIAWYYSCKSSPYIEVSEGKLRTKKALEASIPNRKSDLYIDFIHGKYHEEAFAECCKYFNSVNVQARVRMKLMVEKAYMNIEQDIMSYDSQDESSDTKSYADTVAKAMDMFPKMLSIIEGNTLGVKTKKIKSTFAEPQEEVEPNIEDE